MIYLCTFDKANTVGYMHHFYDVSDKTFYVITVYDDTSVTRHKLTHDGHILSANKIEYDIPETLNKIPVYIGSKRMYYLNNLLEKIIFEKL